MQIDFQPLASSSDGCAYKVSAPGAGTLLIDAGLRFELIRKALEFQVSSIAGCLLSHAHGDHCKGVKGLLSASVDVYASHQTWMCPALRPYAFHHRAKEVQHDRDFELGGWRIKPFEVVHDQPGTMGFLCAAPQGGTLLYMTDSAYSPYKFEGLTHIAIEANWSESILKQNSAGGAIHGERYKRTVKTHMSLERLIDMLLANDLSQVEEIHLLHLSDENSNEVAFREAVERATGKPVFVAAKEAVRG